MAVDPDLADRYDKVRERIRLACGSAGRDSSEVTLIVVSKVHPAQLVLDLLALGQTAFGENKDQEAKPKFLQVKDALANYTLTKDATYGGLSAPDVHFVGQLQSNKAKSVMSYASTIHSLDRDSLLTALAKETSLRSTDAQPTNVFIELNLTDDVNRGGIRPDGLLGFAERVLAMPGLNLLGVMGVASLDNEPERDFALIQEASAKLQTLSSGARFISAGMSNDFELALQFGATHLRIGTAITGPRSYLT